MTDDEIKQLEALAREAVKNSGWTHVCYRESTARFQNAANPAAILSLIALLEKAEAQRDDAYRALVCLVDHAIRDPHWDDHCRVQEKARAFVEEERK